MKKSVWVVMGGVAVVTLACFVATRPKGGESSAESRKTLVGPDGLGGVPQTTVSGGVEVVSDRNKLTPPNVGLASLPADEQSGMSAPRLSVPVKSLLLQDGKKHNYATLLAQIGKLDKDLSPADTAALMDMLAWPNDRFPEKMRPIEINAVKNDVLDKLLRQDTLPDGLGLHMVEMAQNADTDPVWRDYCVQFMTPLYERRAGELAVKPHKENYSVQNHFAELSAVREAMLQALEERDNTLAGTALIGLENLSRNHDGFDREMITAKAVEITTDEMASMESRLTALRLASQVSMGHGAESMEQTADAARMLAQTGESVYMRSAAIVTLGEIGSNEDRELLEAFAVDEDRQIAAAANMALAKMDEANSVPDKRQVVTQTQVTQKPTTKSAPVLITPL